MAQHILSSREIAGGELMSPKEQYEARQVERNQLRDAGILDQSKTIMLMDIADRFVSAVELIAESMHRIADRKSQ